MGEYMLEMNNIVKTFPGVTALDGVTLKVRPGTVHALMGENGAGKSTLMKCLFGIYHEDSGEIILDGKREIINTSKQALDLGVSMIHQELHPIRFRPVMENIWLGRFPMKGIAVDRKAMIRMTKELFEKVDLDINPETVAGELSASTLQLVEIARASYNSKIIIMDEPTSSLTDNETEHLFKIINQLRSEGRSIIYISHKMEEILRISDEVTIMRDGQYVGTWPASELTTDLIINRMVGRDMTNRFPVRDFPMPPRETVLRVKDLCSPLPKSFQNVSFHLHRGEILGIGGLVGAQRTELVEALFGLRAIASGIVEKEGKPAIVKNVRDAKKLKIALLTEERRATGVFGCLSVLDNTVIASQKNYANHGVLNQKKRYQAAYDADKQLNVKTPSLEALMQNLSGGNQQKVLIARWLLTEPDILILDEPTRGIDVGAKYEIYTIMLELVKAGKSIIMISSEMPELLGMSDRVMVMCEGKVSGFLEKDQFDQVEVMRLATQFMK